MRTLEPWRRSYAERFAGRKPRILIGFITFGDVYAEIVESLVIWAMYVGHHYKDVFEICWSNPRRREQFRARNGLVEQAQDADCDFLVMVDDDHPLSDSPDFLMRFFTEEKPFQGALYVQRRNDEIRPVVQKYNPVDRQCYWMEWGLMPKESGPVDVLGGGLNWYDMTMFPYLDSDDPDEKGIFFKPNDARFGMDMRFSLRVKRDLGIDPWLNMGVQVGHVVHERAIIRPPESVPHKVCACGGVAYFKENQWTCMACQKAA